MSVYREKPGAGACLPEARRKEPGGVGGKDRIRSSGDTGVLMELRVNQGAKPLF